MADELALKSGVAQGSILGQALLNTFVKDRNSMFSDDTMLCIMVDTLEEKDDSQRDLDRLK